jgi:hypothetical protein
MKWNRITRGKPCPCATLSTTNPTWTDSGSNPGLRGGRPAANRLSHGTTPPPHTHTTKGTATVNFPTCGRVFIMGTVTLQGTGIFFQKIILELSRRSAFAFVSVCYILGTFFPAKYNFWGKITIIHQSAHALNKIHSRASIKRLHVSAQCCHHQQVVQKEEVQAQHPGAETCSSFVLALECIC